MIGDPFLNYFALGILFFVVVVLFYGIIAIHDIPHIIAKPRDHPHQDAIHAAGWFSLFTLHALWPFLWIWAMAYKPDRGWGLHHPSTATGQSRSADELETLRSRLAAIEVKLGIANRAPIGDADIVSGRFKSEVARSTSNIEAPTAAVPVIHSGDASESQRLSGER
jgi:hypothetical protein